MKNKIKVILGLLILFGSLVGFKYMRDNDVIMPIKKEEVMKLVNQVSEISNERKDVTQKSNQIIKIEQNSIRKDPKEKSVPIERRVVEDYDKLAKSESEIVKEVSEEKYLKDYDVTLNKDYHPSYDYLQKCGKCHGYNGTGFNNGRELMGPGIVHYSSQRLFNKLMDYKNGELQGDVMKKVATQMTILELREISKEVQKLKKN